MPLYKGKTTIQALGGNRIEWKAQFRVEELGKMLVTAPPCNMRVAWAPGPPGVCPLRQARRAPLEGEFPACRCLPHRPPGIWCPRVWPT